MEAGLAHVRFVVAAALALGIESCASASPSSSQLAPPVWPATVTVAPPAYAEKVIWDFTNASDGSGPLAGVVADPTGNLYATTQTGGVIKGNALGTVDEFSSSGSNWTEATLYTFHGFDGSEPYAPVIFDARGNVDGTTLAGGATYGSGCNTNGCGAVFQLTHGSSGWSESVLYSFTDGSDGGYPQGPLSLDQSDDIYGTTEGGGDGACPLLGGCGTVFELTHSRTWKERILHAFTGADGKYPYTRLIVDTKGNIFGTTPQGGSGCGSAGCGVVFELVKTGSSWTLKTIHAFAGGKDGASPAAGLLSDSKGNLYGTTTAGGTSGFGVAYEFARSGSTWKQKILFNFSKTLGVYSPYGELTFDTNGNLFGAAAGGNTCTVGRQRFSCGVIFELSPARKGSWKEATLLAFTFSTSGWNPNGALLLSASGTIFGTTQRARRNGAGCCGAVYQAMP
ncbi:MAG: hypothetical protein JO078_08945 [Candidatus Eremiobacteraeota bacterium]|nr:hypothetical protein [Candidatus Eremiobacteraeota bacterium]